MNKYGMNKVACIGNTREIWYTYEGRGHTGLFFEMKKGVNNLSNKITSQKGMHGFCYTIFQVKGSGGS
jgi:hypothetical protein